MLLELMYPTRGQAKIYLPWIEDERRQRHFLFFLLCIITVFKGPINVYYFESIVYKITYKLYLAIRHLSKTYDEGLPVTATELNRKGFMIPSRFSDTFFPSLFKGYSLPASCTKHTT